MLPVCPAMMVSPIREMTYQSPAMSVSLYHRSRRPPFPPGEFLASGSGPFQVLDEHVVGLMHIDGVKIHLA
jgi:hypothetical protein